jgi:hypothetical protein
MSVATLPVQGAASCTGTLVPHIVRLRRLAFLHPAS